MQFKFVIIERAFQCMYFEHVHIHYVKLSLHILIEKLRKMCVDITAKF